MDSKFNNTKSKLDSPKRREMLPIDKILSHMSLSETEKFADIGCGIGFFSIPAAEYIGQKGRVYALDVNQEMIQEVDNRIIENNITNIQTILSNDYNFILEDNSVSYAFICTVLHEIEEKERFINEAKRILNVNGRIAIIEFIKKDTDWGPSASHRLDSSYVKQILEDCGFTDISIEELNDYFYIITASV